jgi:hypothetical protein
MTNILKNNFEKFLRDQYGETIESLERVFSGLGIDFFLIGALSRDLWLRMFTFFLCSRNVNSLNL